MLVAPGNHDYFPRLAGKPAGYLMNQLVAFRDGRRRYPPMNDLLEYLPDAYLQGIADYFEALRPPPLSQPAVDAIAAVLARGVAHLFTGVVVPAPDAEALSCSSR